MMNITGIGIVGLPLLSALDQNPMVKLAMNARAPTLKETTMKADTLITVINASFHLHLLTVEMSLPCY